MATVSRATLFCPSQIACEGTALTGARVEKGICLKCEKKRLERSKGIAPRGINSALPEHLRRMEEQ